MTEPGAVFLPKPSWWVRRDRSGYSTGTYGWESHATGGTNRIGRGTSQYGWTSSLGRGDNRYDTFTRPNSTTSAGPNWINKTNKMGVHSGKAYPVTAGAWNAAVWKAPMLTDNFVVSATVYTDVVYGAGGTCLYFGCDDPGANVLMCMVFPSSNQTGLATRASWTAVAWTAIGSAVGTHTYASGNTVSVERAGTVYTVRLNGDPCWTWNDTAVTHPIDSAHRLVGIGGFPYAGGTFDFDNFRAKEL